MATKSATALITALLAGTKVEAMAVKGNVARIPFSYAKVAGNTDGDFILLAPLHTSWSLDSLRIQNVALTGCTDVNVGLYRLAMVPGSGAVIGDAAIIGDGNQYADAISFASALGLTEVAFEERTKDKLGQKVWQDAGLSEDTDEYLLLALTLITGGTAAGAISGLIDVRLPG